MYNIVMEEAVKEALLEYLAEQGMGTLLKKIINFKYDTDLSSYSWPS